MMIWQMVAHPRLGPHMHMDCADKDCGVREDVVHMQAKIGWGMAEGMVDIVGRAATRTAVPNWEERLAEIAVGWEGDL